MSLITLHFNGEERVLAAGLTIRSLLSGEQIDRVQSGELAVCDGKGRERGLDGAVQDGLVLTLGPRRQGS